MLVFFQSFSPLPFFFPFFGKKIRFGIFSPRDVKMFFLLLFSLHLSSFFLHRHLPKSFFLSSAESCVERLNIYIDSRFKGFFFMESNEGGDDNVLDGFASQKRAKTFYAGKAEVNVAGNDHIFCFVTGGSAHVQMQLSTKECESLGLTGLALCLDCNTFAEYVKDQGSIEA
ncbi:uncharacterized protein [Coffea arabica]|uniref:Uncharacterized protein isoform X2 n=1 Tax=Coffea arabica TaxID=13443 RepID=A0A6P6X0D3_COFAR|nr:uncharacterized protein LOC113738081 isoform X2 [Coffea arabica]